jgi:hypothetical protein
MRILLLMAMLVAAGVVLAALPIDERREAPAEPRRAAPPPRSQQPAVPRARCPAGVAGCRSVRGRVVFVERVDPDGDGDLHVVVLDGAVTAPGVTAVDVRAGLRPARDPRVGDQVSAAGPVQPGSFGQQQIHALEFHAE